MRDDFYDRYIVNNGLFGPIMQLLEQVHDKNNLVNSAILELLNFVRIVRGRCPAFSRPASAAGTFGA